MAYSDINNGGLEGARTSFGGRGASASDVNTFGMTAEDFERQLRESVGAPVNEQPPQNPFDIAKYIAQTGDYSFLEHLEEMIRMFDAAKSLSETEDEKKHYEDEIAKYITQIEAIQRQIDELRKDDRGIQEIHNLEERINGILEYQKNNFERVAQLLENIDVQTFNEIDNVISEITNSLSASHQYIGSTEVPLDYLLPELRSAISRYQQDTGKLYAAQINYYDEELIRKYALAFCSAQKRIEDVLSNDPDNRDYQYINSLISELIKMLYIVHDNPLKVAQIKTEIEETLKAMQPSQAPTPSNPTPDKDAIKQGLKLYLTNIYRELADYTIDSVSQFIPRSSYQEIVEKENEIANILSQDDPDGLTAEEKEAIRQEVKRDTYDSELARVFGINGAEFVATDEYNTLLEQLQNISTCHHVPVDFEDIHNEFKTTVDTLQRAGVLSGVSVDYDENNSKISITFRDGLIGTIEHSVVSIKVKEQQDLMGKLLQIRPQFKPNFDECIRALHPTDGFRNLANQIKELTTQEKYPHLTNEEISTILDQSGIYQELYEIYGREYAMNIAQQNGEAYDPFIAMAYGQEFVDFLMQVMRYYKNVEISDLNNFQYGTIEYINEYEKSYHSIMEFINNVKNIENYDKFISISYDEETERLNISYKNNIAEDFEVQIVPEGLLNRRGAGSPGEPSQTQGQGQPQGQPVPTQGQGQSQGQGQPQGQPAPTRRRGQSQGQGRPQGQPVPTQGQGQSQGQGQPQGQPVPTQGQGQSQGQGQPQGQPVPTQGQGQSQGQGQPQGQPIPQPMPQPMMGVSSIVIVPQDKDAAIQKYIDGVNHYNELVAELNVLNQEIAMAEIPLTLDMNELAQISAKEARAKFEESQLREIRQQLAQYRFEYKNVHNEYITQNPQILATRMDEPVFGTSMQEFIQVQDDMALDAEQAIRLLANRRAQEPHNAQELTDKIRYLAAYIDSRNSIIGRCLVAESKNNNIDIVSILAERRANKRSKREMITRAIIGDDIVLTNPTINAGDQQPGVNPSFAQGQPAPQPDPIIQTPPQPRVVRFELRLKETPKINRQVSQIAQGIEPLSCQIIKNKLKIQFSADLKEKLKDLSAKVSLVDKKNKLKRTSVDFDPSQNFQELGFADGRELTADDYRIEIRSKNGQKSELLYDGDIVQVDEGPTRTR